MQVSQTVFDADDPARDTRWTQPRSQYRKRFGKQQPEKYSRFRGNDGI
jgi:hypothetical protein